MVTKVPSSRGVARLHTYLRCTNSVKRSRLYRDVALHQLSSRLLAQDSSSHLVQEGSELHIACLTQLSCENRWRCRLSAVKGFPCRRTEAVHAAIGNGWKLAEIAYADELQSAERCRLIAHGGADVSERLEELRC